MAALRSLNKQGALSWAKRLSLGEHSCLCDVLKHSGSAHVVDSDDRPLSIEFREGYKTAFPDTQCAFHSPFLLGGNGRADGSSSSSGRQELAQMGDGHRCFATSAIRERTTKSMGQERVAELPVEVLKLKRCDGAGDLPRVFGLRGGDNTSVVEKDKGRQTGNAKGKPEVKWGRASKKIGDAPLPQTDGLSMRRVQEGVEAKDGGRCREAVDVGDKIGKRDDEGHSKHVLDDLLDANGISTNPAEREKMNAALKRFHERGWAADQALALYVNSKLFEVAAAKFKRFVVRRMTRPLLDSIMALGPSDDLEEQVLFPLFAEFVFSNFGEEIRVYKGLVQSADMTRPYQWFPSARSLGRKIFYHWGPTNSGKTHNALQAFKAASSGIYCGPLRLLAMEIYDRVNADGIPCSLHTGQEKREVQSARHMACTVEMADFEKPWDVAIIDEIQMINNSVRGWAWTRSLLGIMAKEVHVCGDGSALELFRSICSAMGEELVEHKYDRHTPLRLEKESLRGRFDGVKPGDCVAVFSRKEIFQVKQLIEEKTGHKCCVIYGALPPETRWQQANLFNDASSGYDVLVASDAIGMGLNLNIKRVIFYAVDKFDGVSRCLLPPPMVKQIAGRAGRRGSLYEQGSVTAFHAEDMTYLRSCLKEETEPITSAGLFPIFEQVEVFSSQLPDISFEKLLDRFADVCRVDGSYFLCSHENMRLVAQQLVGLENLTLQDRYIFCLAPVNIRNGYCRSMFKWYALGYSVRKAVPLAVKLPESVDAEFDLLELEAKHQVICMYLWLGQYFPSYFTERQEAEAMAVTIAKALGESLARRSKLTPYVC